MNSTLVPVIGLFVVLASAVSAAAPQVPGPVTCGGKTGDQVLKLLPMPDGGVAAVAMTHATWRPGGPVRCIGTRGKADLMVWRTDRTGRLLWCTVIGGRGDETVGAFDKGLGQPSDGSIVLAGSTASPDFPFLDGHRLQGRTDGFVVRLSPDGRRFLWTVPVSGPGAEELGSIAGDGRGGMIVCGNTTSRPFPGARTYGPGVPDGYTDALVGRVGAQGHLDWLLVLGGHLNGDRAEVALPLGGGDILVGGSTWSPDFPVSRRGYRPGPVRKEDCFVVRLTADGVPRWSALVGGSHIDRPNGMYLGEGGSIWLAGSTGSADLPVTAGASQAQHGQPPISPFDADNGFVAKLTGEGSRLLYCSYLSWSWPNRRSDVRVVSGALGAGGLAMAISAWRPCSPEEFRTSPYRGIAVAAFDRYGRCLHLPPLCSGRDTAVAAILPGRDGSALVVGHPRLDRIAFWRIGYNQPATLVADIPATGMNVRYAVAIDGGKRIAIAGQTTAGAPSNALHIGSPQPYQAALAVVPAPPGYGLLPGR